ncbi:MAG: pyridoxal-phosphate dependent enzyme [Thermodesulfobacteriota bacterium]
MSNPMLYCPACDSLHDPASGLFSCPGTGDGREHILDLRLDPGRELPGEILKHWANHGSDPLLAFAPLGATCPLAGETTYAGLVRSLQDGLDRHEGRRLAVSPLVDTPELAGAIGHAGRLALKDETGQPGGSHKARHLAGTMLYLEALRRDGPRRPLAISSCGNAALAAACVARASGYELTAFVPGDVHPEVAAMLSERGARVSVTPRLSTGVGDPCYLAFREAVKAGAAPFCCSGRDNWSNIEGGRSLGFEAALQWRASGGAPDHLVLQTGGGALARSVASAFEEMERLGFMDKTPRVHACQTEGAFPFARAWLSLLTEVSAAAGVKLPAPGSLDEVRDILAGDGLVAGAVEYAREKFSGAAVQDALRRAVLAPSRFMRPWDGPVPRSLAHGILDDETYDWFFLARAMLRTGGRCVIAPEPLVARAHALALKNTGVKVSATGSAGLAGLMALREAGAVKPSESACLFFTGINR